jgi:thiol-disulfide isomerase/thioredoxin
MSANVRRRLAVGPVVILIGLLLGGCGRSSSTSGPADGLGPLPQSGEDAGSGGPADGQPTQSADGQPTEREEPSDPTSPAGSNAGDPADPANGEPVTVRVVDESEFAEALRRYQGKVVLVDYWATWCPSCLKLFPHTVELSARYSDRGLVVISLSMDDPENQPNVLKALQHNRATFDNFISRYGGSDKSAEAFGLEDLVLPKYRLYDRNGEIHSTLRSSGGPIRPEDIDRAVEALLAQP